MLWLKQFHVSFKSRQTKFVPAAVCRKQNFTRIKLGPGSVHVRAYAYAFAYGWNLEKKIRESIFIIKLGWLINISHYAGVFVLGIPSSFYLLSGVKWF